MDIIVDCIASHLMEHVTFANYICQIWKPMSHLMWHVTFEEGVLSHLMRHGTFVYGFFHIAMRNVRFDLPNVDI